MFAVGWALMFTGCLIRLSCFRALGRMFTFELTVRKDHKLITTGPYAYVRHPSYLGGNMASIGVVLCHLTAGSWLLESGVLDNGITKGVVGGWLLVAAFLSSLTSPRTKQEDNTLHAEFGKSWEEWAKKVRFKMIPGIY